MKKRAYIVIGHSDWGKSQTLSAFTNGDRRTRHMRFFKKSFFVRRISNDDNEEALQNFVRKSIQLGGFVWENYLLMTLCPVFKKKYRETETILDRMLLLYDLYFFVLHENYNNGLVITEPEIDILNTYGNVEILFGHHEASSRARQLLIFIRSNLLSLP